MNYIDDIEEKRLQVLYFLSQKRGGVSSFTMENIFKQWCHWWRKDFGSDCQNLKVFQDEIILSLPLEKYKDSVIP